jgi:Gpi18-like mannosyltransferase
VVKEKEVIELGKIFEKLKRDARAIVVDLALGIRSFGIIGFIGVVLGVWAIGERILEFLLRPVSPISVGFYVVFGVVLVILSTCILRRYYRLKKKYSWIFKAEKSLGK